MILQVCRGTTRMVDQDTEGDLLGLDWELATFGSLVKQVPHEGLILCKSIILCISSQNALTSVSQVFTLGKTLTLC